MRKLKKFFRIVGLILAILLLLTGAELLYSNLTISVSRYALSSEKIAAAFHFVFLSDLHGMEFGSDNQRLLSKIAQEQPDAVFMVGDIVNNTASETEIDAMSRFIAGAAEIAPVYFSLGNHEANYIKTHDVDLKARLEKAGAVVLDNQFLDLEIRGVELRLGGYTGCYRIPHLDTPDPDEQAARMEFAKQFEDTDRFKLLLSHIPIIWLDWEYRNKFPVDLVLCGHYHGGVMRIPILEQGLIAPYVGWFPPYTKGLYEGKTAACMITTGLAGYGRIPRFFNPPEICVVDLTPAAE